MEETKLNEGMLKKSGEKRPFTIRGKKIEFEIYEIPIEKLLYNHLNGRIASYISEYEDTNGSLPEDRDSKNNILENYIVNSSPDSFKKTKNNIKIFGQIEAAVVLDNGVVIDGNRRFSALRQLNREGSGQEFAYLKAAIIPEGSYNRKEMKVLELNLQHGKDNPVDYNPIEKLVDIYRDLIKGKDFTDEEYARETDTSIKKIREDKEIAKLMVEYLDFINQHEKFHIARNQKLDGPLREIHKIIRSKYVEEDDIYDIKQFLFSYLVTESGDMTRKVRSLRPLIENSKHRQELIGSTQDTIDDMDDYFRNTHTAELINKTSTVEVPKEFKHNIVDTVNAEIEEYSLKEAQQEPIKLLEKSLAILEAVDKRSVELMNYKDKSDYKSVLKKLRLVIDEINIG